MAGAASMTVLLQINEAWPVSVGSMVGLFALSLIASLMLRAHLAAGTRATDQRRQTEKVVWAAGALAVLGVQLANLSLTPDTLGRTGFLFMAPIVAQAMLVSALVSPGIGILSTTMTVVLLGLPGVIGIDILLAGWLAGAISAHIVNPLKQRSDLIRAMSVQVGAQAVIAAALGLVTGTKSVAPWEAAAWGAVAAVLATAVFWLAVPIFERLSGIVSDWRLLELCSPEQELLHSLVLRAPGTYAHSVGVANLAEEAARSIGANPLLCRTMAYYHDIGKSERPSFFIENQQGTNVHDDLSPVLSAQTIAAHVSDGAALARQHRLPQVIVQAIEQHHGTSLITYFFHRAMQEPSFGDEKDQEHKFRYPGPKPQTKEIAVLHLADMVEAASRVMPPGIDPTEFVAQLVRASREDGQLDESELTFRELQTVTESFGRTLAALRHDRIAYPEQETEGHSAESDGHQRSFETRGT